LDYHQIAVCKHPTAGTIWQTPHWESLRNFLQVPSAVLCGRSVPKLLHVLEQGDAGKRLGQILLLGWLSLAHELNDHLARLIFIEHQHENQNLALASTKLH
jgi:hypothetical protein